jgi:hypothetical protein
MNEPQVLSCDFCYARNLSHFLSTMCTDLCTANRKGSEQSKQVRACHLRPRPASSSLSLSLSLSLFCTQTQPEPQQQLPFALATTTTSALINHILPCDILIRANMAQPDISSILAALGKCAHFQRSIAGATDAFSVQLSRTSLRPLAMRHRNMRRPVSHRQALTLAPCLRSPLVHFPQAHTFLNPQAVAA